MFALYLSCAIWGFVKIDYLKGIVSDAMRELFNKALTENLSSAKYAVNEIQKQVFRNLFIFSILPKNFTHPFSWFYFAAAMLW